MIESCIIKRILLSFFLSILFVHMSYASVTLVGTRVIYPANKPFVSLNFRSSDNVPSIMDLWISTLADSTPHTNDAPFAITPSIFRIDPNKGQSAKLIYTGSNLPSDRESIFYLNFVQLPASDKTTNKLLITYKSTVKVFYRPSSLKQNIDNIDSYLKIELNKLNIGRLTIFNNSEFYVTPTEVTLNQNGKTILLIPETTLNMIAPFSHESIKVKPINNIDEIETKVSIINDLGGISNYKITTQ